MTAAAAAPSTLAAATDALAAGRPVLLVDDAAVEPCGVLVIAADTATTETTAFLIRYTAGYLRVAISDSDAERLLLPPMWPVGFGVAVDAVAVDAPRGTTTGISAHDRACTLRTLADPATVPGDLTRPGHVVPVRIAARNNCLDRDIGTAAFELATLGGANGAAYCAVVSAGDDTTLAGVPELRAFAEDHGIVAVGVDDLHRRRRTNNVERVYARDVASRHADLTAISYQDVASGLTHLALVRGDPDGRHDVGLLVRSVDPTDLLLGTGHPDAELLCVSQLEHAVLICLDSRMDALPEIDGRSNGADVVCDAIVADLRILSTQPICEINTS